MFALDTNSLTYFFKGMGRVGERLLATPPRDVSIPSLVIYEIEFGIAKSPSPRKLRTQLETLLRHVQVLPFDAEAARASSLLRAELEKAGTPIGPIDTLIAGTAVSTGSILVTHNINEFARVKKLKAEDWY